MLMLSVIPLISVSGTEMLSVAGVIKEQLSSKEPGQPAYIHPDNSHTDNEQSQVYIRATLLAGKGHI